MSAPKEEETSGATKVASVFPPTTVSGPAMEASPPFASRRPSVVPSSSTNPTTTASAEGAAARPTKSKKKKSQSGEGAAGENTGRWTAEEHRLFLQGLEQHGKGWKKIASLIKSRTVVQIRTHAQKYFQKLAKARQNGEEGDVTMEGRGDTAASASSVNLDGVTMKRRQRLMTGTKRKAIQSVVNSAQRQRKKLAAAAGDGGVHNLLPAVAPALAHFVLPQGDGNMVDGIPPPGSVSSSSLEDALFRFLTPCPPMEPQVNEVAKKAGANPITVPKDNKAAVAFDDGEVSPTGVNDLSIYPPWTNSQDPPSWYAKGADVDALLDVVDTLDWIADSGDPAETFQPPAMEDVPSMPDIVSRAGNDPEEEDDDDDDDNEFKPSASVSTLPRVDSTNVETMVPSLPSLFNSESTDNLLASSNDLKMLSNNACMLDAHLQVFENSMEEHAFVSTILDSSDDNLHSFA